MKRIHGWLGMIPLLLTPLQVWAAEPLSLNDCFNAALERSNDMANQQENLNRSFVNGDITNISDDDQTIATGHGVAFGAW